MLVGNFQFRKLLLSDFAPGAVHAHARD